MRFFLHKDTLVLCLSVSIFFLIGCNALSFTKSQIAATELKSKKTHNLSTWPQNCDYFVFKLGTDKVAPERVENLDKTVIAKVNQQPKVKYYNIYLNSAENMMDQATSGGFAASGQFDYYLGGSVFGEDITLKPKCSRDEMTAGWFDPAELTNNISPLIIDLKVEYNGKDYSVYSVYSPDTELQYRYGKPEMTRNVNAAMDKAHKALIEKIRADEPI
ncbi:hypothetical protein [Fretibacter rubidus]|uniref:hypothetical protein n=1 Tax=Fretibacter rubidus TaxID=570162 RepID=UPI00352B12BC